MMSAPAATRWILPVLLLGCASGTTEANESPKTSPLGTFVLRSTAFQEGEPIPPLHTCDGADTSPALQWEGAPANTMTMALIVDDPDAPGGNWTHWIAWDFPASKVPADAQNWPAAIVPADHPPLQGINDFSRVGWGGPCPPVGHGIHHYRFRLFALARPLDLPPTTTRADLEALLLQQSLAVGTLTGTHQR